MVTRVEPRPIAAGSLDPRGRPEGGAGTRGSGPLLVTVAGANLWLLGLGLPALYARAADLLPLVAPAPLLLALGVARRGAPALLLGVPLAALAPLALPELASAR